MGRTFKQIFKSGVKTEENETMRMPRPTFYGHNFTKLKAIQNLCSRSQVIDKIEFNRKY